LVSSYLLIYVFVTFIVGVACFAALVVAARRDRDGLARAFLMCYGAMSVMVMATLLLSYVDGQGGADGTGRAILQYIESFIGRYALMLTLPLFVHRLFAIPAKRRERALLILTAVTFVSQHFTEFWLPGSWDDWGDVAEDVILGGVVVYAVGTAINGWSRSKPRHPFATPALILLLVGVPGIGYDLFLRADSDWAFYPLLYCLGSLVGTAYLLKVPAVPSPTDWSLSPREEEVLALLRGGLSNKAIARRLSISPNTVKTHLSAIYDKAGIRTRVGLVTALSRGSHPKG
jgi:DNA-binding CsgD family transcriptional regulator